MRDIVFKKNDRVVELYCGDGSFINSLGSETNKIEYLGIDTSNDALKMAANWYASDSVEFKIGDPRNTGLPDSCADCVIIHVCRIPPKSYDEIADEIVRVIKPDGKVINLFHGSECFSLEFPLSQSHLSLRGNRPLTH